MRSFAKTLIASAGLSLALPVAASAQETTSEAETTADEMAEFDEAMAALGAAFAVEPLTEEQLQRLPLAEQIVGKIMPPGAMAELMDGMFGDLLGPIMEMAGPASNSTVADQIGVSADDLALSEEESAELAQMFDPVWEERNDRMMAVFPTIMSNMMAGMEPSMRKAMSELYAINFDEAQLTDIDAFFSTESGAEYARKSFTMASDPRVMAASMEALPTMMAQLAGLEEMLMEQTADLPEVRAFSELSPEEQARVVELTGYSAEEIEANLAPIETYVGT